MRIELISPMNNEISTTVRVLTNRGINIKDINHYLSTSDDDINDFKLLGEQKLKDAATAIITAIKEENDALIVVDCDCDGYTSAAILANYLYDQFPSWVTNHLKFFLHNDKSHGLEDNYKQILESNIKLVILPDAGSNDVEYSLQLKEKGISVICLDHHEMDKDNPYAIIINNQDKNENYPNKHLSGAGVVYQFCRYLDSLMKTDLANNYLDLCALGNCGDVMDTASIETKHLINEGFKYNNRKNPFVARMSEKNAFKLGYGDITFMGAAFYIVPLINAVVRTGTIEEKELLFNSMLKYKAFEKVPSTKRGHKLGETELVIDQSIRMCGNVKNRQTKEQEKGEAFIEDLIKKENLDKDKILLILLNKDDVRAEIRGLIANRLMSRYQRPCAVLTYKMDGDKETYQGSMRGYTNTGITNFKDICEESNLIMYCAGHQSAAGLGVEKAKINEFKNWMNNRLAAYDTEIKHRVDYLWNKDNIDSDVILTIADLENIWSSTVQEPLVAIENIEITEQNIFLYKEKTIKIHLPNVDLMIFNTDKDNYENLIGKTINIVGTCHCNTWNGQDTAQIFLTDWEEVDYKPIESNNILSAWGF